ncbi:hypothetical protein ACQPZF_06355 [Actinosynnema sp. CS-041913]|uniref:hypothetical protein n=1 Tax=Actinosynnema sp. CS-041913 TaxID=3239917 RepID=UPI003D8A6112
MTALTTAAPASAEPGKTHEAGDPRATVHEGNIDIGQKNDACDALGLPGDELKPTSGYSVEGTNIDITANPTGYEITAVVVKGSSAYNIYYATPPANVVPLGELPWLDLHPPLNASDEPAGISHWFVCAEKAETPPTSTQSSTTRPNDNTSTTPPNSQTQPAPATTITTSPAAAAPGTNGDLANTGFGSLWLLSIGLALVAAGAAFVASPNLRRLLRR